MIENPALGMRDLVVTKNVRIKAKIYNTILLFGLPVLFSQFRKISEALFLTEAEQHHIGTLFQQINEEYQKDNYELDLLIAYCNLIFTYIGKCYKRQFNTRQPLYNKIVVEFKKLLNTYYKSNINELPNVNFFAEKLNLSPNYLSDLLKNITGKNAQAHIQESLVERAKELLSTTNLSIKEIAYNLGFEYPQSFSTMFKKNTQQTPLQFRASFN